MSVGAIVPDSWKGPLGNAVILRDAADAVDFEKLVYVVSGDPESAIERHAFLLRGKRVLFVFAGDFNAGAISTVIRREGVRDFDLLRIGDYHRILAFTGLSERDITSQMAAMSLSERMNLLA